MYLFIDPSIHSMGVALFEKPLSTSINNKIKTKLITSTGKDWKECSNQQIQKLRLFFIDARIITISHVVIEYPSIWGAGSLAASGNGSLLKLAFMVGRLCENLKVFPVQLVRPEEWKGQLTKDQVINRICRILQIKKDKYKLDEWDAVGIGLWKAGLL